jgi:hypothetical protein
MRKAPEFGYFNPWRWNHRATLQTQVPVSQRLSVTSQKNRDLLHSNIILLFTLSPHYPFQYQAYCNLLQMLLNRILPPFHKCFQTSVAFWILAKLSTAHLVKKVPALPPPPLPVSFYYIFVLYAHYIKLMVVAVLLDPISLHYQSAMQVTTLNIQHLYKFTTYYLEISEMN